QSKNAEWKVIETPGHAIDHVAFLNTETGQLFSGDLYCQEKTKVILKEESIPTIIQSLQKVFKYDFGDVFCQHAGYLDNGRTALEHKLEQLLHHQGNNLKMQQEAKHSTEIKETLFSKNYPLISLSIGEWDSQHIVELVIEQSDWN